MSEILEKLIICIERGKVNEQANYPPDLKGEKGADELCKKALDSGMKANEILRKALMEGMNRIGDKFSKGQAFIPDLLMSAKAMNAAMVHLKPFFESGEAQHRGTLVIGTVTGDLHDIGKNIVKMVMEGDGWKVIDLGVDVADGKFLEAIAKNPDCVVGLSALLTTTMLNMEQIVKKIKNTYPQTKVFVGGAPLSAEFCEKIGADGYFPDPHSFARRFH